MDVNGILKQFCEYATSGQDGDINIEKSKKLTYTGVITCKKMYEIFKKAGALVTEYECTCTVYTYKDELTPEFVNECLIKKAFKPERTSRDGSW